MKKNTAWQIGGLVAVVVLVLFSVSTAIDRTTTSQEHVEGTAAIHTATITIEGIFVDEDIQFTHPTTVLGVLQQMDDRNEKMELTTKEYSGLGTLVESMGGNTNGTNDQYWQYKVNGIMPQIGADKLEVKSGDTIEWYFDKTIILDI